jgi:hypothetical protein
MMPSADRVLALLEKYDIFNESVKITDPLTDEEVMSKSLVFRVCLWLLRYP